jgi:ATP-dependent helicase Lhr and Lhr-like helicase
MPEIPACLSAFHPLVREWFLSRYGSPTPVQREAWPEIEAGRHVLALAPTGSGKTLTAFLEAISRIASGDLPADRLSVLYVSPLKALGEDVRRNLERPLEELSRLFADRGEAWPGARAATRTGDTSPADRRRMLKRPPSILVTTPESLALMLDSPASRAMLSTVRLLVLDEIHVLAGDKRGALLACSVGRLALLAGEFQRIALSATARPVEALAAFVGGRRLMRCPEGKASYEPREVRVVSPPAEKAIELRVEWPEPAPGAVGPLGRPSSAGGTNLETSSGGNAPRYAALIPVLAAKARETRGLLVFTDSRRRAERMAFLLNEAEGEGAAWAHHGSLSKEARRLVEERFKAGELGCVVATASLELGIDVGGVEEVALAGSPGTVASALQRVGRSGHGVGEVSRGTLYPFHGMDLVLAAAIAKGVRERAVEDTRPLACPLDVLAQALLELSLEFEGEAPLTVDALYDIVRSFPPFERLPRGLYDATLGMLAGRYSGSRVRELERRVFIDAATGAVAAAPGARGLLASSGGTIPDRGLYSMRLAGAPAAASAKAGTRIGELDEEFVFERKVGEVFSLGAQAWKIVEIGSEAVTVAPATGDLDIVPFWKGDAIFRSPGVSSRALELLDRLEGADAEACAALLEAEYGFEAGAARACADFVAAQKAAGGGRPSLPGTRRLVLEVNEDASAQARTVRLVLHTLRGLAVNAPLAMALATAIEDETGLPAWEVSDDDRVLVAVPRDEGTDLVAVFARALSSLAAPGELERRCRSRLEASGLFGSQFRQNAARALLLPRGMPGRRVPLWMTRLRAKKLFEAVSSIPDFPITVETWRSCLSDLLDLEGARALAAGVSGGSVALSAFPSRAPSPFAREALWREIGGFMYAEDSVAGKSSSSVSDRVVAEALRSARLRPRLKPDLVEDFGSRLKRLVPGWAPEDPRSLAEWVKERVFLPATEFEATVALAPPDLAELLAADPGFGGRIRRMTLEGAAEEIVAHAERAAALAADPASHVAEWLRREGPVSPARIAALLGIPAAELDGLLDELAEEGTIVVDAFLEGSDEIAAIDAQNLEILLRRSRAAARKAVVARPAADLARLVAALHGLGAPRSASLDGALERLAGFPAPAGLWETELLPARTEGYSEAGLDAALGDTAFRSGSGWQWFGSGKGAVSFCRPEDLELFLDPGAEGSSIVPQGTSGLDFWALRDSARRGGPSETDSASFARELWAEAWKGLVASDSFDSIREGIANGFGNELAGGSPEEEAPFGSRRRVPRALRERWRGGPPVTGRWFRLDLDDEAEPDALDRDLLDASRVRSLAARYGLLCRDLLEREAPRLRWGRLFPAMRRLELAGELLAGRFFEGIDGPQFLDPSAFALFTSLEERAGAPAWINALDPAASALYAVSPKDPRLPTRTPASRICIEAGRVAAVSTRSYRELSIAVSPDDSRLAAVLSLFRAARTRPSRPEGRIVLDSVNGEGASRSPYAGALREAGFEADRGRMVLW